MRADYYTLSGKNLKSLVLSQVKRLGGRERPTRMTMESRVDEGSRTRLEFLTIEDDAEARRPAVLPRLPRARGVVSPRGASFAALALALLPAGAFAQTRQLELGVESFAYRSATTPLNRENVLGLDDTPGLGRLAVGWRETHGSLRAVFRGYVERTWGTPGDGTDWVVRQGYAQYWWGEKVGLRLGKQRIAWGSGFAWNPTNRLEPPKNALNTTLEQEGALAARLDWAPTAWASLVLVGATTDATPRDLPVATADVERRDTVALRARFLVRDTDVAVVASGREEPAHSVRPRRRARPRVGRRSRRGRSLRGRGDAPGPRRHPLLPRRGGRASYERGERLRARVLLQRRGLLRRGHDQSGSAGSTRRGTPRRTPRCHPSCRQQALRPTAAARPSRTPAAWACGATTSTPRGRGAERPRSWTGAVRTVVGLDDGAFALTPGVGWAPRGNLTLNLDAVLLLGPDESEYRLAPVRGGLQARVKVLF